MTNFMPAIDEDRPELLPREDGGNGQLMPVETKIGDVVAMRRAALMMPRQPSEVRRLIAENAELFGDSWEYRFPVKNNRTGMTEWIEGPTIGCTMAVARAYGNNDVAHTRTEDEGNSWILYSTFLDLQSGFSLTRGFRQRKGQSRMGGDRSRGEDIDFQIGVSKSTRNVVARALDDYVQYARQQARHRLAGSIGKRPDEYRERIAAYLSEISYPLNAVEGAIGAKIEKWTNEQIASVVRTLTAHKDGILSDLDAVYRPKAADAQDAVPQDQPATPAGERAGPPTPRQSSDDDGKPVYEIGGYKGVQAKRAADEAIRMIEETEDADQLGDLYSDLMALAGWLEKDGRADQNDRIRTRFGEVMAEHDRHAERETDIPQTAPGRPVENAEPQHDPETGEVLDDTDKAVAELESVGPMFPVVTWKASNDVVGQFPWSEALAEIRNLYDTAPTAVDRARLKNYNTALLKEIERMGPEQAAAVAELRAYLMAPQK